MRLRGLGTIFVLTLYEARQRKILLATLLCGLAFITLYAVGFYFMQRDVKAHLGAQFVQQRLVLNFFIMAGLYAVNFLTIVTAVLMPVDSLSGEIASGVMQTVASKPIHRSAIVLGKWLGHAVVLAGYLALMSGGVLLVARVLSGLTPPQLQVGLPLMLLEGLVLLTLSIAGGTRLSTITNGVLIFGLFGIAFVGSWTEQVATLAGNDTARRIGTLASLIMPSESMWQLAAWHMQPEITRSLQLTPFSPASVPNAAMVIWTAGYVLVTLAVALRSFARRPL
jgi:ABC-type transport system involved in multi-copper enzyme maturation permease subunit